MNFVVTTKKLLQSLTEDGCDAVLNCVTLLYENFCINKPNMSARYMDDTRAARQKDNISFEHHYRYDVF